jgi:hypothetical protein
MPAAAPPARVALETRASVLHSAPAPPTPRHRVWRRPATLRSASPPVSRARSSAPSADAANTASTAPGALLTGRAPARALVAAQRTALSQRGPWRGNRRAVDQSAKSGSATRSRGPARPLAPDPPRRTPALGPAAANTAAASPAPANGAAVVLPVERGEAAPRHRSGTVAVRSLGASLRCAPLVPRCASLRSLPSPLPAQRLRGAPVAAAVLQRAPCPQLPAAVRAALACYGAPR